jgi:prolyl-tRNA editing enzyme YbaK/EbsC (Cys-tRNA(Pro) deacylase)
MIKLPATQRVRDFFAAHGNPIEIREFPAGTRTAQQAAEAVNAPLGSIVKSLVFIAGERVVLALVAGDQRGDAIRIAQQIGAPEARIANADEVRIHTGFVIGGVPPAAHPEKLETLVDETLLRFKTVWAAAGTPHAVFEIETRRLIELTQGRVVDIAEVNQNEGQHHA